MVLRIESAGKRRDMEYKNMEMKRKIYVASSWRNEYYPEVVEKLREETTVAKIATVVNRGSMP